MSKLFFMVFAGMLSVQATASMPETIYARLDDAMAAQHITPKEVVIVIHKLNYTLSVTYRGKELKTYPCVFGRNPIADKRFQGDRCTPEGTFHIKAKYPHALWSKFIWIDYPNEVSWEKFRKNFKDGRIPVGKSIGGDIGIHGVSLGRDDRIPRQDNWTEGCISLSREDVDELYRCVDVGTEVRIYKE